VNPPNLRFPAAAFAALSLFLFAAPARASLSDHPQPAKLDSAPPATATPATSTPAADPLPPPSPAPAAPPAAPAIPATTKARASAKTDPATGAAGKTASAAEREDILSLARKGLLDSAFAKCKTAFAAHPNDAFLLLMMGKLSPGGKESAEYFKQAIKAGGPSPEAEESQFRLGQFHYAAGKYYLAIPFFRDYLKLFPNGDWQEPAHYWMGNACMSLAQGRPDKVAYLDSGAVWFQKLLDRSKPEDYYYPLALEGLAKAKAAKGDREGAWLAARTALDKAPEEEQSPLLLLAAQLRQGIDREEEKGLMARLMSHYPQSPEARYLRKLNSGVDTAKWKAGSGLPRPALPPAKDSLSAIPRPADSAKPSGVPPVLPLKPVPAATIPAATTPAQAAGKNYTLQLGAFSQAANAQAMMANVAKFGLNPDLVESTHAGKRIYQVRLGRFATVEEAAEYAKVYLKPHQLISQPVQSAP